jgi:hypothetical protein
MLPPTSELKNWLGYIDKSQDRLSPRPKEVGEEMEPTGMLLRKTALLRGTVLSSQVGNFLIQKALSSDNIALMRNSVILKNDGSAYSLP